MELQSRIGACEDWERGDEGVEIVCVGAKLIPHAGRECRERERERVAGLVKILSALPRVF